jgi:NAD(P)-dependent dehydrogenase (short-subunit alcohol dehydrogenase family)
MKLEGKVALVTGAGQGIGKEIALAYAREGAKIGVNDKAEEQALSSVEKVRALGQEALPVSADVSSERPVRDMVETMLREFGREQYRAGPYRNRAGRRGSQPRPDRRADR